ncbi:glycosyltransferase family 9 protein [Rahnella variigena]|uniref:Glycosyltransferase family 9 protein n=1 Tax=Rahnella variigena TaxID=574964 RepID=A0ABX9Q0C9_9GAMM|nr:glycosyltransferase family 9 protein [Rahnella variigena]RJT55356.1 lipopolysaccharide heptosyltransferase family protein [Rahnella variigena]RKF69906.1 hypothetical protein CKQ54_16650 [Rahnella variigena]
MAFKKLRHLNRKKNIFLKKVKLDAQLLFLDKIKRREPAPFSEKMNIVMLCNAFGIGDAIVMSGLVNALHQQGHNITMLCEKRTAFIFEHSPLVDNVIVFEKTSDLKKMPVKSYDLLIDINDKNHLSPLRFKIIKALNPKIALTLNQNQYKIYDISIDYHQPHKHTSWRHRAVLNTLGYTDSVWQYALTIPAEIEATTAQFLSTLSPGKLVVINPYSTEQARDMSPAQLAEITTYLAKDAQNTVVYIGTPAQLEKIDNASGIKFSSPSFLHAAALIKAADLVISPDTSVVHLCKVYNKNLICLYNNKVYGQGYQNNIVWGPDYDKATQILSPGKRVDQITTETLITALETSGY